MSIFDKYNSTVLSSSIKILNNSKYKGDIPAIRNDGGDIEGQRDDDLKLNWLFNLSLPAAILDDQNAPALFNTKFAQLSLDLDELQRILEGLARNKTVFTPSYVCHLTIISDNTKVFIILDKAMVEEIISLCGVDLTPTEVSIVIKTVSGLSLKEISENDGVSYDTRRKQFSKILSKFGFNKNTEMIIFVNNVIYTHIITAILSAINPPDETFEYKLGLEHINKHYANSCRVLRRDKGNGESTYLLDIGPIDGHPVLSFHSIFQPIFFLPEFLPLLYRNNLRLLTPVRPGYFDTRSEAVTSVEEIRCFSDELDQVLDELGIEEISILSVLRGTIWAAGYLENTQRKIRGAVFSSASLAMPKKSRASISSALMGIVNEYPSGLRQVIRLHAHLFRTPNMVRHATHKIYCKIEQDREHMEALNKNRFLIPWLCRTLRFNVDGITKDFLADSIDWRPMVLDTRVPIAFLHGVEDRNTPIETIRNFVDDADNKYLSLKELPDTGILYVLNKMDVVIAYLLEQMERP